MHWNESMPVHFIIIVILLLLLLLQYNAAIFHHVSHDCTHNHHLIRSFATFDQVMDKTSIIFMNR